MPPMLNEWISLGVPYTIPILTALFLLMALLLLGMRAKSKKRSKRLSYTQQIIQAIQPDAGLENNLNLILEIIGSIVEAQGYAFYVRDSKTGLFLLKSVRHLREDLGKVAPSYSGLAPYEKEKYLPPLSLAADSANKEAGFIKEGEIPLCHIPLSKGQGLIRLGPTSGFSKKKFELLMYVTDLLPNFLDVLIEAELLRMKADVVETSSMALQQISSMSLDSETVIQKMFGMVSSAMGMSGGSLFISEAGTISISSFFGWSAETKRRLREPSTVSLLIQLIGAKELVHWDPDTPVLDQTISLIGNRGDVLIIAGRLPYPGKKAWFVCGFPQSALKDLTREQLKTSFQMMITELAKLVNLQNTMKTFGQTYSEFLKRLSSTIDDLNPYTVGYSEMMSRYSVIIAKEMGLPLMQIRSIGLAAHLSNIGVLGLSEDLYLKEGKFTEVEFEKMKLHAEVGASIIEMTIGDMDVAKNIRHHHERMDGNGYPHGLRGEEIPIGARIISVVQTFLAKINGRKYRDPLSFDKAIQLLESLAGVQLDVNVVQAFVRWFEKKRHAASVKSRSLGPCWEMCCTPVEVCRTCPAFQNNRQNCWEMQTNNCQSHGKSCETCFVYTEIKSRSATGT
ncbi:HD-GYP domain-containing protein [Cohnella sp.]|uniref:HD-GYP domain-containing protein n=1 Tax=Cohnella sp. TaxID=1883426 RepID=UPI003562CD69